MSHRSSAKADTICRLIAYRAFARYTHRFTPLAEIPRPMTTVQERPEINWVPAIILTATPIAALTVIPWYAVARRARK